jgi:hypothetical protein
MQIELHPKHFVLLRIAKLRGLKVRNVGLGQRIVADEYSTQLSAALMFAVTSHTRRADGLEWVVTFPGLTCSCPAKGQCTHLSAALDHYFINCASPADYTQYTNALIEDRYQLRLRIRANETTRNDRVYLRYCERLYRDKLAKAEAVSVPPVTQTVVGGRTVTRCGTFTI